MSAIKSSDNPRAVAVDKLDKARSGSEPERNTGYAIAAALVYIGDEIHMQTNAIMTQGQAKNA